MSPAVWAPKAGSPECKGRASAESLARIAGRLGLAGDPTAAGARLVMLGAESDSMLWFVFQDGSGREAWLAMAPAGGEPWAFNGRNFKLSCRPQEAGFTELDRAVLARLSSRFAGTRFERFRGLVEKSAAPARAVGTPGPEPRPNAPQGPHSEDWAHPEQWREFSCFPAIEWCPGETFLGAYELSGDAASIRYGDLECQSAHLYINGVAQTPWAFTKSAGSDAPAKKDDGKTDEKKDDAKKDDAKEERTRRTGKQT